LEKKEPSAQPWSLSLALMLKINYRLIYSYIINLIAPERELPNLFLFLFFISLKRKEPKKLIIFFLNEAEEAKRLIIICLTALLPPLLSLGELKAKSPSLNYVI